MRKSVLLLLLLTSVVLAGCLPQVLASPTTAPTTTALPSPTVVDKQPAQAAISLASSCTVVSQKPTPGPTAESIYPPITGADWVKGPADAKVTIIEYSDFQ